MSRLHALALLFGCLLLAAPISRVTAEDDEYADEDEESTDEKAESDEVSEADVVVLTGDNFDEIIEGAEFALVEFYAPWCGHCKNLVPEWAKAATLLKEHDDSIVISKVDATENKELAQKFNVGGYPTIKWFVKGKPTDYNGPRDSDGIVRWVKKKTGPPADTLTSVAELEALEASNEAVVLGYFKKFEGEEFEAFLDAARQSDDVAFAQTVSKKVATAAGAGKANTIAIVKNFATEDRATVEFDKDITSANVDEFVSAEKLPLVIPFMEKNQEKIFDSGVDRQILLVAPGTELTKESETLNMFKSVAGKHKGKLIFVTVDASESNAGAVMNFFGIAEDSLPQIVGFQIKGSKKFQFTEKIELEGFTKWAAGMADGSIGPSFKSQDPPEEDMDEDVQIIVGKTVDSIVKDPKKDVLLEIYAPWCGHCKSLEPIYKKLGKRFAKIKSVVIAKMDGTENEHKDIEIQGFPSIMFFPAKEDAEPIVFEGGDRSLKALTKFIKEHAEISYTLPKKVIKEDEDEAKEPEAAEEEETDKTEL